MRAEQKTQEQLLNELEHYRRVIRSALLRYGVATLASGVVLWLALGFRRWIAPPIFPMFLAAVAFSAWYGDLGPGLLTALLAVLAIHHFFLPLAYPPALADLSAFVQLAAFGLAALLISLLNALLHAARRRTEEEQWLFHLLVEDIKDYAIFLLDPGGRVVSWNKGAERVQGYQEGEILNRHFSCFYTPRGIQRGKPRHALRVAAAEGRYEEEGWRVRRDGSRFWASTVITVLRDRAGNIKGFSNVTRDITRRKRLEKKMRQQNEYLATLNETALALMNRLELDDLLKTIVTRAGALVGTPHGFVCLLEPEGADMVVQVGVGILNQYVGHRRRRGEGLVGKVWQTGKPLAVKDYGTWPDHLTDVDFNLLCAVVGVPLKSGPEVVGVLGLTYLEEGRAFGEDQILLLTRFAELASIALDNARLYAAAQRELAERKRAEEQIRFQASLLDQVRNAVIATDLEGRILYWNKFAEMLYQWRSEEMTGKSILEVIAYQEQKERAEEILENLKTADHWEGEFTAQRKDGTTFPVYAVAVPIKEANGSIKGFVGVSMDIAQRKRDEETIRHLAYYDALTDLPNRVLFTNRLNLMIAHARRNRQLLAVMFLDLDRFKTINDTLGHTIGDRLLQSVAQRVRRCLREVDTVARLGGDEFALLLLGITHVEDAARIARKILETLKPSFTFEDHELRITASIGIALYPNDGEDAQTLLKNADTAMYQAKEQGRNSYKFYNPTMNATALERLALENSLRRALERGEFVVHYQPRVNLATGHIVGMEALVRWQHPELGLIPPSTFIPVAEETNLIVALGEWVLRTACAQNKAWQEAGFPPLCVSVNLSAHLFKKRNLVEMVAWAVRETGLDPDCLDLEVTEGTVMENAETTISTLRGLKGMGIRLSIDDFGTGYSSLNYLKRFPIDTLKIDQSFVQDIFTDPDDAEIAKLIVAMAHSLKLKVIAEGVETEEQLAFLHAHQCDEMQGYLFSKPVPAEVFTQFLQEGRRLATGRGLRITD